MAVGIDIKPELRTLKVEFGREGHLSPSHAAKLEAMLGNGRMTRAEFSQAKKIIAKVEASIDAVRPDGNLDSRSFEALKGFEFAPSFQALDSDNGKSALKILADIPANTYRLARDMILANDLVLPFQLSVALLSPLIVVVKSLRAAGVALFSNRHPDRSVTEGWGGTTP